jgi:DNA-binding MarR family transcriptional regulator
MDDLRRLVQALRQSAHGAERRHSLSGAQLFVLQELRERPAGSIEELAARTFTDQSSVSAVVSRLVERGLCVRTRAKDDGRRVEISLTARGRGVARRSPATAQAEIARALGKLRPRELRALAASLHTLIGSLGLAAERPALFFEKERG